MCLEGIASMKLRPGGGLGQGSIPAVLPWPWCHAGEMEGTLILPFTRSIFVCTFADARYCCNGLQE